MTAANFPQALKLVLAQEGGWSNHPQDPGKATMKGVTQAVYDAYRDKRGQAKRSVRSVTNAEVEAIYRKGYWDLIRGDDLPIGVDAALMDYAVNSGPGKAVKDLQRGLGCRVDGLVGPQTLEQVVAADDDKLINDLCDRRLRFLKSLKIWKDFGRGWTNRVLTVRTTALAMLRAEPVVIAPPPAAATATQAAAKAPVAQQAQLKTAEGQGLSCLAAGTGGEKLRQLAEQVHGHVSMDTMLGRFAFAAFTLLIVLGGGLVAYSYVGRIREKGGLGGFIGSVFRP